MIRWDSLRLQYTSISYKSNRMLGLLKLLALILLTLLAKNVYCHCTMADDVCEFWLEVSIVFNMMYHKDAVYAVNNTLYKYDVTHDDIASGTAVPIDPDRVIIADGWETPRLVIAANHSMPGPPIEVYENQVVIVHVKNKMKSDALTVHWHGMDQLGTPWMDGVPFVTQCPIPPGTTFTYRFRVMHKGTFWYHSHMGAQLGNGLVGAFIVREKTPQTMDEHIVMLQDWNHDWDADVAFLRMEYGSFRNRKRISTTDSLEGAHFSNFLFQSGLVNGRGRYFGEADHYFRQTPLTVYPVEKSKSYRFRVVGAGNLYPFRVSIDGHNLTMVASDGYEFEPIVVESFVINPGERFDFELFANQDIDNYYLRAETLEVNVINHVALAIVRYNGATETDPIHRSRPCAVCNRCVVLNCPYRFYPKQQYTDCVSFGTMRSTAQGDVAPGFNEGNNADIEEIFINWAFPGNDITKPASANGVEFKFPPSPPLTQPTDVDTFCKPEDECGEQRICSCTNSITLEHGKSYQFVFTNLGKGKGWAHPIHMHGHSFYVVKIGYPSYDPDTGKLLQDTTDIDCHGGVAPSQSFCNRASWSNSSWSHNNIPGLELERAPRKDTVIVPTGGYTVIRIKADNPGVWLMHCHIELHSLGGMALILNESFHHQPRPPANFPKCGNFDGGFPSET